MRGRFEDLTGKRFGQLVVVGRVPSPGTSTHAYWECVCDCGGVKITTTSNLNAGLVKSCGCLPFCGKPRHGRYKDRVYNIWLHMKSRCNGNNPLYGGRGISVCKEWESFEPFYAWAIDNGYDETKSIDRIDNNGNYCPGNCRWATRETQANNTRRNLYFTVNGRTATLAELVRERGMEYDKVYWRVKHGWNIEKALCE